MSQPEDKPFKESHLDSPEYRRRLMRKLNTLIAVLEVACAKVRRTMESPDADQERLGRISKNLKDTLKVCLRAKKALEKCQRLPKDVPTDLSEIAQIKNIQKQEEQPQPGARPVPRSREESERFQKLGPIDLKEVRTVDLDALCKKLLG